MCDKNKSVNILTFWGVPNYGAWAQAYALRNVISEIHPEYNVRQIAFLHPEHRKLYFEKRFPKPASITTFIHPGYYRRLYEYFFKDPSKYPFFEQAWNSIPHIDISDIEQLERIECDVLVTGSDVIWQFGHNQFGDDEHLIGNNMKYNKLVAYACSFGDVNPDDNLPSFVEKGLLKYDSISVRDLNSRIIVEKYITNKEIPIVLDPTLMYDFRNDKSIGDGRNDRYILVYGSSIPLNIVLEIKKYAIKNKCRIIGAGRTKAPTWCDERLVDIDPRGWIALFKDAEFVVTSTFHGLMFSLIYEKKFLFYQEEYVKNRSQWILEKIGISDLFNINDLSLERVIAFDWKYSEYRKVLEGIRKESLEYLRNAI